MNILFTCAGRRNYLLEYFREVLNGGGRIFAADSNPDAPALQSADMAFIVPPLTDSGYMDTVFDICKSNDVRIILSLNDLELPLLAESKMRFLDEGIIPVVSSPQVVDICFDKMKTNDFLDGCGLKTPKTYGTLHEAQRALRENILQFPLTVKPRWGTASIGIEFPEDNDELELAYRLARKKIARTILSKISASDPDRSVLIQEKIQGREYGLDIVNDLKGNFVCVFVKRKLAMRAGETDRAVVVENAHLSRCGECIGKNLKHVGNLDCDVFLGEDEIPQILEMNPRFGGGYPFSHVSGANIPAALIAWADEKQPDPACFVPRPGVTSAKCDRLVITV